MKKIMWIIKLWKLERKMDRQGGQLAPPDWSYYYFIKKQIKSLKLKL